MRADSRSHAQHVGAIGRRVVVVDRVLTVATAEDVQVVAGVAVQLVVAGTALQHVIACTSIEVVVTGFTEQRVRTFAAVQVVVARAGDQCIVAGIGGNRFAVGAPKQHVGVTVAVQSTRAARDLDAELGIEDFQFRSRRQRADVLIDHLPALPRGAGKLARHAAGQLDEVAHAVASILLDAVLQLAFEILEIKDKTRSVRLGCHHDHVDQRLQAGLQHERHVDRLAQGFVAGIERVELRLRDSQLQHGIRHYAAAAGGRLVRICPMHDLAACGGSAERVFRECKEIAAVECFEHREQIPRPRERQLPVDAGQDLLLRHHRTGIATAVAGATSARRCMQEATPVVHGGADLLPAQSKLAFVRPLLHRVHSRGLGPFQQQLIEHCELLGACRRRSELRQEPTQVGRKTGRFPKIANQARARHVRQVGHACGERHVIREFPVERIFRKVDVGGAMGLAYRALATVGTHVGTEVREAVAVGERLVVLDRADVDRNDAELLQREKLTTLRYAVLIQIAPDAQLIETSIGGRDGAIAVGVLRGERSEAILGVLPVRQLRRIAEQLASRVDRAVAIAIEHEQAVIG